MPYDTPLPPAGQLACSGEAVLDPLNTVVTRRPDDAGNELISLLNDATRQGLIEQDRANETQGRFAVGLTTPDGLQDEICALLAAGPAAEMALEAVAAAYTPGDVSELRALDPAGGPPVSLCYRTDDPAQRAEATVFIRENIGRRNIYIGANPRRADLAGSRGVLIDGKLTFPNAADVVARRVVVLDLDLKDAPSTDPDWTQTVAEIRRHADPLLLLNSGNGYHIWLSLAPLSGPDVAASSGPLAAAMAGIGSDNMADPARIVRLPFTPNLPNATKRKRGAVVRLAAPLPGFVPKPLVLRSAPPSLDRLCRDMEALALRRGLPGRGGPLAASARSRPAPGGGEKTGWAAPSADLLRLALSELPNYPGGPFDHRGDWQGLGHAVKGAALAGGFEAEGREAFAQWSLQWGGDPDEPGRVWDGITNPHTGWGAIMRTVEAVNPAGADRVKAAVAQAAFSQEAAANRAAIASAAFAPASPITASQIPPRRWFYGRTAITGFVSFLVAPGGAGKSALAMVEAVAMASGRELLQGEKPVRPMRVWAHNAEDDLPEMQRRLAATLMHFRLTHADLHGNLFLTSGRDMKLQLARTGKNGPEIVPGVVDALVERAKSARLDVITLDPLGALHTLPENSNEAANLLSGALREIAHRADVAVIVLHHAGKAAATDMDAAGAGASRGASAFVDAARVVRQMVRMTEREAAKFGITDADRRDYLRVENGKANLARAENGRWLRMVDVPLGNGAGLWPLGDRVGVVERWTPPGLLSGTARDLARVQAAVAAAATSPRYDVKARDWVGFVVADALGLNIGLPGTPAKDRTADEAAAHARVRGLLDGWFRDGGLIRYAGRDSNRRHDVEMVAIGKPALVADGGDVSGDRQTPDATADADGDA